MCKVIAVFLFPIFLSRISDSMAIQQIGRNKMYLRTREDSKRALPPSLNIRKSPSMMLDIVGGDTKQLNCEAGGNPPPTIHWLKDGKRIAQSLYENEHSVDEAEGPESTLGLGFTRSRLFFGCATPSDAGQYACVAENEYIREYRTSQVSVSDTFDVDAICLTKKNLDSPARIHMWTHTRLEIMGTDVQLFCRSDGNPRPHVTWRGPNDRPLSDNQKYQIMANGDLVIRNILWSDMGGYTCQAKNSEGTDQTSSFLYPTQPEEQEKR